MSEIHVASKDTRRAHNRAPVALDPMAAVASILPQLGELPYDWGMPLHHWSRETMVRFLLEAVTLVGAAIATGDDPTEAVSESIREATAEAYLAYEFAPGSYTVGALRACRAASQAVAGLRATKGAVAFRGTW